MIEISITDYHRRFVTTSKLIAKSNNFTHDVPFSRIGMGEYFGMNGKVYVKIANTKKVVRFEAIDQDARYSEVTAFCLTTARVTAIQDDMLVRRAISNIIDVRVLA